MKYIPIKEKLNNDDIGIYESWGIKVVENNEILRIISDVFISYQKVRKLCMLCNQLGINAEQLDYVIEDAVNSLE